MERPRGSTKPHAVLIHYDSEQARYHPELVRVINSHICSVPVMSSHSKIHYHDVAQDMQLPTTMYDGLGSVPLVTSINPPLVMCISPP